MTSQLPQAQQQIAEAQGTEGTHTFNAMFWNIKESTEKAANKLSHMEKGSCRVSKAISSMRL